MREQWRRSAQLDRHVRCDFDAERESNRDADERVKPGAFRLGKRDCDRDCVGIRQRVSDGDRFSEIAVNLRQTVLYGLLVGNAAIALARCSSTSNTAVGSPCSATAPCPSTSVSPDASPGNACPAIALQGPPMIAPSPGATGVSTAAASLEIASNFSIRLNVSLVPGSGATLQLGTIATPTPAPGGTPGPISIAYPQLARTTTYTVTYTDASGSSCPDTISSGGSFTTF